MRVLALVTTVATTIFTIADVDGVIFSVKLLHKSLKSKNFTRQQILRVLDMGHIIQFVISLLVTVAATDRRVTYLPSQTLVNHYRDPSKTVYSTSYGKSHSGHNRRLRTIPSSTASSFDWSGSSTSMSSSRSLGSSLSATFNDWSKSVTSMFAEPRVYQMKTRCSPEDIPGPADANNPFLYSLVQGALGCNPEKGSTVGFTTCLEDRFPDLAPTPGCYKCILEFVDKFTPTCDPRQDACVRRTLQDLVAVCSP